jgi:hypothetical protein
MSQSENEDTSVNNNQEYFEIKNYEDKSFDVMMADYCKFHKRMTEGKIPPRFVFAEISRQVDGGGNICYLLHSYAIEGFGNRAERAVWCFLYALLTGRAFVFKFEDMYEVSNVHFSAPCFDWNYHREEKFKELPQTAKNFQDPALETKHLPTVRSHHKQI